MNEVLVVDIGGTKTNVSLLDKNDENEEIKILNTEIFKTNKNPELQIQKIKEIGFSKNFNPKANKLSLSLPGKWDKEGVLKESYFLHEWLNYPFVKKTSDELGIKECIFETDVICGGLGEYHFGVGALRATPLLYLNLGTGIGAALINNGKPYKVDSKPVLRMQKLVLPFQDELYSAVDLISGGSLQHTSGYESIETLFSDYKKGEVNAVDILMRAQVQLSAWIINLFYLFGPDVIVLNGGLTYDWDVLAEGAVDLA